MILLGLIGKKLRHSYSKDWFNSQFKTHNTAVTYENFELSSVSDIRNLLETHPNLIGFNVTIPFKEAILPLLDCIDLEARKVGAVNTVGICRNGNTIKLHGYNTDVFGFEATLKSTHKKHSRALVFGNGGAAKAVTYVLKKLDIDYKIVSRSTCDYTYNQITKNILINNDLLINTTPVGMFPNVDDKLPIPIEGIVPRHTLIDLIYNPSETQFMKMGKAKGAYAINGQLMLEQQAVKALEIFKQYSKIQI